MSDSSSDRPSEVRTLVDLARLAGVDASTVSRALADNRLVNPQTRARIQALAREHRFRPNQMARRLRTQRTGVIGIAIPLGHEKRQNLSDPFFLAMIGELADRISARGCDIMLSRVIPDADDWLERIALSGMLDGLLLIGQSDQGAAIDRLADHYRPLVVWGSRLPTARYCTVGVDNVAGGRLAGEALIARGCRTLAFMGNTGPVELADRHRGLAEAAAEAGLAAPRVLPTPLAADEMAEAIAANLTAHGDAIDGIAAGSDVIAMQTVRTLADRGVAVPDQVAVVGFDDLPIAAQAVPRLTTIRQDLSAGAEAMVAALFARIAGQDAAGLEMMPTLIRRDTA